MGKRESGAEKRGEKKNKNRTYILGAKKMKTQNMVNKKSSAFFLMKNRKKG